MKLLTKNTDYAIRSLLALAQSGERFVSSRELAQQQVIPLQYIRRILQDLVKAGYVVSKEGISGGVKLAAEPRSIIISDIIQFFQGPIQLSECLFQKKLCHNRATCVLRHRIKQAEDTIVAHFKGITLQTLLDDIGGAS